MMAAVFTSIVESVGDYYACARICGLPLPPAHAVNRGIASEGISGIICGLFGSAGFTTSYSQNVGAIGFTKVNINYLINQVSNTDISNTGLWSILLYYFL